ncbi:ParB/RepB/Spo0J family partition protein, partial [Deinococcus pimensis]|uniref:ParB/RepB/Spo0J family partition protein n=1 Tax=Deinococcus pimensis TaxID=309888 RepID=UPI000693EFAA
MPPRRPDVRGALRGVLGAVDEHPSETPREVDVTDLTPLPGQPRRAFDDATLAELSRSVREHGVLQPLLVRRAPGGRGYEIVAGERRWRAAKLAGLARVPVVVRDLGDREALEAAIVENLQREDLNPVDRTDAVARALALALDLRPEEVPARLSALRKTPGAPGHPEQIVVVERLFETLGGSWVTFLTQHLPILRFPGDVLAAMRAGGLEYTKGRVIAGVRDETRRAELLRLAAGGASLEQLRAAAAP